MSNKYPGGFVSLGGPESYSCQFNGSNQSLTFPVNSAFDFGTNACCVEAWVYRATSSTTIALFCTTSGGAGQTRPNFVVDASGGGIDYYGNAFFSGTSIPVGYGVWTHVAFTRASTNGPWRFFVNGALGGYNATGTQNLLQTTVAQNSGVYAGSYYTNGFVSNLRITNGSVPTEYQTSSTTLGAQIFAPPTGPLQNIANTSLLTCQSPTIVDNSSNGFTIINNNSVKVSTNTPLQAYNPNNLDPALGAATPGVWTLSQAMNAEVTRSWPMYDPYYKNVVLNLHGDGTNAAQNNTFLDSSSSPNTLTRNGNTTQGSFSPYGTLWSTYFPSTSNLSVPAGSSFAYGTGTFTVEAWINLDTYQAGTYSGAVVFAQTASGQNYFMVATGGSGEIALTYGPSAGTAITTAAGFIPLNKWTHVAVVREGTGTNQTKIYVNGTLAVSGTCSFDFTNTSYTPTVGNYSHTTTDLPFKGYISNVRVVKGTAVYTGQFTPSASPLTAVSGTSLLTCQSNRFIDNGSSPQTVSYAGSPTVQRFSPFYPALAYNTATTGGSGYFDGTTDYLVSQTNAALALGTSDFCVEWWEYRTSIANDKPAIQGGSGTGNNDPLFGYTVSSSNRVYLASSAVSGWDIISSGNIGSVEVNTWNHFVFTRSGTRFRGFKNGVLTYTTTSSASIYQLTNQFAFGTGQNSGQCFSGYMSDARVNIGGIPTSYQTSSTTVNDVVFTPPTSPETTASQGAANTKLLLNMTNAGIYDNAMMNDLETVGNAQISTSVKKYGTGSMYFDGTGDGLLCKQFNQTFGGDFTVEFWIYRTGTSVEYPIDIYMPPPTDTQAISMYINNSGAGSYNAVFNGSTRFTGASGSIPANQWAHVAMVRASGVHSVYINGVANASTYTSTASYSNCQIAVGRDVAGSFSFTGYIDDLRITKGVARYVGNFTPPTSQLQDQ